LAPGTKHSGTDRTLSAKKLTKERFADFDGLANACNYLLVTCGAGMAASLTICESPDVVLVLCKQGRHVIRAPIEGLRIDPMFGI
jgi:hypothetical protein